MNVAQRPLVVSLLASALALVALPSSRAAAESVEQVPNPRTNGSWVTDLAGVLSASDVTLIDGTISALEQRNGAEIAVVTVRTTSGKSAKQFAHELFNRWGVGKKDADNGVLVLLAKDDRRIEIETGYGAEGVLPDGKVGDILDDNAVPAFRVGEFGTGLVHTVRALSLQLAKEEPAFSKVTRKAGLTPGVALALLGLLAAALVVAFLVWWSRRPKKCPKCRREMRLLSEEQENAYLDRDQEFEEHIHAYDWQVWRCDDDEETVFVSKGGWFSGFKACAACGRKTASSTSHTLRSATYSSTGLEEIVTTCRLPRCRHRASHTRVLPMKVRSSSTSYSSSSGWSSSSSSSSSFGGGSSGGGGAGRSW